MNRLLAHRYVLRKNLISLIGVCLCFYFIYHAVQGNRSVIRLTSLNKSIATMSQKYDSLQAERIALETKVKMLRPGSVNRDLLEERARLVLGYKHPDEVIILRN